MSLSDFQKFLYLAETDPLLKSELNEIREALEAAAEPDEAILNVVCDRSISQAASKNLNVVLDDFGEWYAQASEDESKDEMSGVVELTH